MKQEKIEALLVALGSKKTGYRSGWVEGPCPFAQWTHIGGKDAHPSFAIKAEAKKKSICKCLSCGEGGDLMDLMFRLRDFMKKNPNDRIKLSIAASMITNEFEDLELSLADIPEYGAPKPKIDVVFPESWLATFKPATAFPEAMRYLRQRWITKEDVEALEIKFDPLQRRVGFPFRNFKGELMGVQGRAIDKDAELRYFQYGYKEHRNLHIWLNEQNLDFDKPLILCEGPFDLTRISQFNPNVAASFTSGLSLEKLKRLSDASEVVTFYDYGSGGNAARKRIKEVFKNTPITNLIPTEEQDDAGNMTDEELIDILGAYVQVGEQNA